MRHNVASGYVRIVLDMCCSVMTRVDIPLGINSSFIVRVGVHQGTVLILFLFIMLMDDLLIGMGDIEAGVGTDMATCGMDGTLVEDRRTKEAAIFLTPRCC